MLQLKDENGKLLGVDASNLLIANSGNDLPVRSYVLIRRFSYARTDLNMRVRDLACCRLSI